MRKSGKLGKLCFSTNRAGILKSDCNFCSKMIQKNEKKRKIKKNRKISEFFKNNMTRKNEKKQKIGKISVFHKIVISSSQNQRPRKYRKMVKNRKIGNSSPITLNNYNIVLSLLTTVICAELPTTDRKPDQGIYSIIWLLFCELCRHGRWHNTNKSKCFSVQLDF